MEYSGAGGKLIHEKKQKQKISWHCPFKFVSPIYSYDDFWSHAVSHVNPEKLVFLKSALFWYFTSLVDRGHIILSARGLDLVAEWLAEGKSYNGPIGSIPASYKTVESEGQ